MSKLSYTARYADSWALVIGINAYNHVGQLTYATNDADAVAGILPSLGFPSSKTVVLKDAAATRDSILSAYLSFHTDASHSDDRILFFFAGHGHTVDSKRGPVGYLIPVDGDPGKLASLLRWDDFTRNADLVGAKHMLFIIDACYSGLAMQRGVLPAGKRFLSDMLQRHSRQVITAGKADETVADGGGPDGRNSIFTGYLLQGLAGESIPEDGILTANGLMHYVYEKVAQDERSRQTPAYGHIDGDGDFILLTPSQSHLEGQHIADVLLPVELEKPEIPTVLTTVSRPVLQVNKWGFGDPDHPSYGQNELSTSLGENRYTNDQRSIAKAFSWLSIVLEPIADQPIIFDIAKNAWQSTDLFHQGEQPFEKLQRPSRMRTTNTALILYDDWSHAQNSELLSRYLRITKDGRLEVAETKNTFAEYHTTRYFKFVQIIGLAWQVLSFYKAFLVKHHYLSGVHVTLSLVGTRDTLLADYSVTPGKDGQAWLEPTRDAFRMNLESVRCIERNLKLEYDFVVGSFGEAEARNVCTDVAQRLSLAYNHQSEPRCFDYGTGVFPWQQYFSTQRW